MSVRLAAFCDTDGCLAVFAPKPGTGRGGLVTTAVRLGWRSTNSNTGPETCPACVTGRGPVLERGECPVCMGSTVDLPAGATCHYCRHVEPHPDEDDVP
ncbi:hypothetical protein AB0D86_42235 [Streptomyces sp. NPDC048324]|uniref:hypothetical protein n=1 Tax=Streptomyces sp. NPDC048324 TaxID=3157205 RepID=UPI003427D5E0